MANPLQEAIREVVVNSPEFKKVANKVFEIFGIITYFDEESHKVSVTFSDPITGYEKHKADVEVSGLRGVHSSIRVGDLALISFPYGHTELPIINAIIPADGEKHIMPGYFSTNISQGV